MVSEMPKVEVKEKSLSRFELQPCKIRDDKVVPSGEENIVLNLAEFVKAFSVTGHHIDRVKMRQARIGGFIGVCVGSRSKRDTLFVIWRPDRGNGIDFLLKRDRTFPDRCKTIFKVVEADWGSRVTEPDTGKKDTPTWKPTPGAGAILMER
jgi:hypothetical protein